MTETGIAILVAAVWCWTVGFMMGRGNKRKPDLLETAQYQAGLRLMREADNVLHMQRCIGSLAPYQAVIPVTVPSGTVKIVISAK